MSDSVPTVSIVIPVYNGADTISACLDSLLNQTYPADAYEIIVVENGSTDNTTQVVKEYPVRLFHNSRRGPALARNLGLSKSQAEIVAFTDADCVADPNWLFELVRPYTDSNVGGVGGAILAQTQAHGTFVERFLDENPPLVNYISGKHEYLPHLYTGNASYRRSLVNRIGGFNSHLVTAEDVDLSWRLQLEIGCEVRYVPQAIIYHRYRVTRSGLAREYRQWGFGEIMLDTMYGKHPGYPRSRGFQLRRILNQIAVLPRYVLSMLLRRIRLALGRATPYQVTVPELWLLIESSNIRGKLEGLVATRLMTDLRAAQKIDAEALINRLYTSRTE